MQEPFTVSEITRAIKGHLEPLFRSVYVKGEASNCKMQSSGHFYFTLKDADAQLSAVHFKGSQKGDFRTPKDGDQLLVQGDLSVYPPRGNYQLIVRHLQHVGLGELLLKLHQRKEEFQRRGWFDPDRKKKLPRFPETIGVITSPTGAAVQDILQVLTRRFAGVRILLCPVKVQGEGAAGDIARAIAFCNRYRLADLLIVGRGGGSLEDLWAFNEEELVSAVVDSHIPILSAVGHETDWTLIDFASDARAPTPSAAAELSVQEKEGLLQGIRQVQGILFHKVIQGIKEKQRRWRAIQKHPLLSSPQTLLRESTQKLDEMGADLAQWMRSFVKGKQLLIQRMRQHLVGMGPKQRLGQQKRELISYSRRVQEVLFRLLERKQERLKQKKEIFASLHPKGLLQRGYALVLTLPEKKLVPSKPKERGSEYLVVFRDGALQAKFQDKESYEQTIF